MDKSNELIFEYNPMTADYAFIVGSSSFCRKGVDIPACYDDGVHGKHSVTEIRKGGNITNGFMYLKISERIEKIAFDAIGCCRTKSILVDEKNAKYKSVDGVLYYKDGEGLIRYPQEKSDLSLFTVLTDICERAFEGCRYIEKIVITEDVRLICGFAFNNCCLKKRKVFGLV